MTKEILSFALAVRLLIRLLETHVGGMGVNSSFRSLIINISTYSTFFNSFFDLLAYKLQDRLYL